MSHTGGIEESKSRGSICVYYGGSCPPRLREFLLKWEKPFFIVGFYDEKLGRKKNPPVWLTTEEYIERKFDTLIVARDVSFFVYLPIRAIYVLVWLENMNGILYDSILPDNGHTLLENVALDGVVTDDEKIAEKFGTAHIPMNEIGKCLECRFQLEDDLRIEGDTNEKVIGLVCNWSKKLSEEWKHMLPNGFPYRLSDHEQSLTFAFNGSSDEVSSDVKVVSMEPSINRLHLPGKWKDFAGYSNSRNMLEWHLQLSVNELESHPEKSLDLSAIVSKENRHPGHKKRHELLTFLDTEFKYHLYGRDVHDLTQYRGPLKEKNLGLLPFRYHLAIESCSEPGYFTEKIADGILAECLCFYWGCPNLEDFIDSRAFIRLPESKEDCLRVIRESIDNDEFSKRIHIIRNEKKRLIYGWSMFPTLLRMIDGSELPLIQTLVLNLDRRPDRWESVTKELYGVAYRRETAVDGLSHRFTADELKLFQDRGYKKRQKNPYRQPFTLPVLACGLSHIKMWWKIVEEKTPWSLILEDDIVLQPDFHSRWKEVFEYLSTPGEDGTLPLEVCFLGYLDDQDLYHDNIVKKFDKTKIARFSSHPRKHGGGTHAYFITLEGAKHMLQCVEEYGAHQAIDWFMIEMFDKIRCGKCLPHLIEPKENNDSDIQNSTSVVDLNVVDHNLIIAPGSVSVQYQRRT